MNDEKFVSDSDMEDIAGGAGKSSKGKMDSGKKDKIGDAGKGDAGLPGTGAGPYKGGKGDGNKIAVCGSARAPSAWRRRPVGPQARAKQYCDTLNEDIP